MKTTTTPGAERAPNPFLQKHAGDVMGILHGFDRVRQGAEALARASGRPFIYLKSCDIDQEDLARDLAARDGIREGLIGVFSCVEGCRTFRVYGNRASQKLELRLETGKCTHLDFYGQHPRLGFLHLRLQTWFPFLIQIGLNGHEWLARQMDGPGSRVLQ